jgi:hypothetical protein
MSSLSRPVNNDDLNDVSHYSLFVEKMEMDDEGELWGGQSKGLHYMVQSIVYRVRREFSN